MQKVPKSCLFRIILIYRNLQNLIVQLFNDKISSAWHNRQIQTSSSILLITRFCQKTIIPSKTNPYSGSKKQKGRKLKFTKSLHQSCHLFEFYNKTMFSWCFCISAFENILFSNKLFSCTIFCSISIVHKAGKVQIQRFFSNIVKTLFFYGRTVT